MSTDDPVKNDDQELVRRMALKDGRALEAFYDRYHRVAFALVLRIVRVRQEAEDVLAEVFWQVWRQSGRYTPSRGKPLAWLLTIARTRAIDNLREVMFVELPGHREEASQQSDDEYLIRLDVTFILREEHLDRGVDQECAEEVQDPVIARDQGNADHDHEAA